MTVNAYRFQGKKRPEWPTKETDDKKEMGDKVSGRQRGRGVDRSKSGVSPAARKLLLHLSLHCALGVSDTLGQQHLTLFLVCPSCYHVSKSCFCSDVDNANCRTKGFFPVFPFPYQPHTNI